VAPARKVIPTCSTGVIGLAFVIAVLNFLGLRGAELHEPIVQSTWQWLPVGSLSVAPPSSWTSSRS
jgi:hypothetical protein